MHPYISQALAEARAADWIRAAEANSRARIALEEAAARGQVSHRSRQSHQSLRTRRVARQRPSCAGLTVSGHSAH